MGWTRCSRSTGSCWHCVSIGCASTYNLAQIYQFKPVTVSVSTVFLLLLVYSTGVAWANVLPRGSSVRGTRLARFAPVLDFVNPGEFKIKEVICIPTARRMHSLTSRCSIPLPP